MKPLNSDSTGCTPISSNCVIWSGPTIPCIKLCKGDSVSDTVHKLATELCDIMTTLDINTYDISCLISTGCAPDDFQGLVQLLINKICVLNDLDIPVGGSDRTVGTSIDALVPIAECFVYTNEFGDRVTTMTLSMYVRTIGNKICDLVNQINSMNLAIANHETRITTLENTPPPVFALANLTPVCVLPPSPTDIYSIISATEQQLCELRASLGLPNDIYQSLTTQCVGLTGAPALGPAGGTMGSISGWFSTVQNMAQSYTNLWLTVCDIRAAVQTIKLNCCPTGCDGISITMTAQMSGTNLIIFLTGTIPTGFENCNPAGSLFTISDSLGASYSIRINVVNQINAVGGTIVPLGATPLTLLSDLSIDADICLTQGTTTCQFCLDFIVVSTANCPSLVINLTTDTVIDYTYTVVFVPGNYTVELWDSAGTVVIASTTTAVAVAGAINGSFTGLVASTTYKIRVVADIGGNITQCPFVTITTTPVVCTEPTGVTAAFDIPIACPTCGEGLIIGGFASSPVADPAWYMDDDSPFLRLYDGAAFNDFFEVLPDTNTVATVVNTQVFFFHIAYINDPTSTHGYHGMYVIPDCVTGAGAVGTGGWYIFQDLALVTMIPTPALDNPPRKVCYDPNNGGRIYFIERTTSILGYIQLPTLNIVDLSPTTVPGLPQDLIFNPVNNMKYAVGSDGAAGAIFILIDLTDTVTTLNTYPLSSPGFSNIAVNTNNGDIWFAVACDALAPVAGTIDIYDSTNVVIDTIVIGGGYVPMVQINAHRLMTYNPINNRIYIGVQDQCPPGATTYKIISIDATTHLDEQDFATGINVLASLTWTTLFNKLVAQESGGNIITYDVNGNLISTVVAASTVMYLTEDPIYEHMIFQTTAAIDNVGYLGPDEDEVLACSSEPIVTFYDNTDTTGPYYFDDTSYSWLPYVTYSAMVDNGDGTVTITALLALNATATLMYSQDGGLTWTNSGGFETAADWALGIDFTLAQPFLFQLAILTIDSCGLAGPTNDTFN